MLITRKAAIGFILLAAIIFPFAYSLWTPTFTPTGNIESIKTQEYRDDSIHQKLVYKPPSVRFNSPIETAVVATGIIEGFAFLCYLGLKKIEPYILALEQSERKRVREKSD